MWNFFYEEPLAQRSQLYELNEFFAFLAKAPSGWLQESSANLIQLIRMNPRNGLSINQLNRLNPWFFLFSFISHISIKMKKNGISGHIYGVKNGISGQNYC